MRRTVIIAPGLVGSGEESALRQQLPSLQTATELGSLVRLGPLPHLETPEALWLGMSPEQGQLRQGPLTVAALGADPPTRSTHFHLSLLSMVDGTAHQPPPIVEPADLKELLGAAKKLDTKSLTTISGENLDHALVWEGLGDMATTRAADVIGKPIREHLPRGDAEVVLRRYIDDSINLLSEMELNQRRAEEELPPLNLLWPWGQGMRHPVPNLALLRGERAVVESSSMRLAGLTQLVGYRHEDRGLFGRGINTRLESIAQRCLARPLSIAVVDAPALLRTEQKTEELNWFASQFDSRLLEPLFEAALKEPGKIVLLAPGEDGGLALSFETGMAEGNTYPFDERSLEERSLPMRDIWDVIKQGLQPKAAAPPDTSSNQQVR